MLTLNGAQAAKGREKHLCPMQFDLADRVIEQWSMPGETVYDPFLGIGTVAIWAVRLGRYGRGAELGAGYFADAVKYLQAEEAKIQTPTLFDLLSSEVTA
jgi:DNA modification methylase